MGNLNVPDIKTLQWLNEETQADVDTLYALYDEFNLMAVHLADVEKGERYWYTLVTDSGYNPGFIDELEQYLGRKLKITGEVITIEVVVKSISKSGYYVVLHTPCGELRIAVAKFNYRKSWRLHER
jgi:hypothetical protein